MRGPHHSRLSNRDPLVQNTEMVCCHHHTPSHGFTQQHRGKPPPEHQSGTVYGTTGFAATSTPSMKMCETPQLHCAGVTGTQGEPGKESNRLDAAGCSGNSLPQPRGILNSCLCPRLLFTEMGTHPGEMNLTEPAHFRLLLPATMAHVSLPHPSTL